MLVYVGVAAVGASFGIPWNVGLVLQPTQVLNNGALIPALVAQGEAWRLLSSVFLHSGIVHLGFNMISLYFLGSFVEVAFGRGRFLALYLLSGLSGGLAYLYFGGFTSPAVGASGAIFGLARRHPGLRPAPRNLLLAEPPDPAAPHTPRPEPLHRFLDTQH